MTMSASSSSSVRSLRSPPCQTMCESDGENLSSSRSQLVTTLVGATISALNFFFPSFSTAKADGKKKFKALIVAPTSVDQRLELLLPVGLRVFLDRALHGQEK